MLLDIGLVVPLIVTGLLGLRDGIVRKAVAIASMVVGLVLGQLLMRNAIAFLSKSLGWGERQSPAFGFFAIFVSVVLLQAILYRLLARGFKIGGILDRMGGVVLGLVEGAVLLSSILFALALTGHPAHESTRDSRLYKPLVNIAPQILDLIFTVGPETVKDVKEMEKGLEKKMGGENAGTSSDTSQTSEAAKQNKMFDRARSSTGQSLP